MTSRLRAAVLALLIGGCASLDGKRPPPPTVAEIVAWSKERVPPEEIVRRMEHSRAEYPLPASELAKLHDHGVADAVIDYMQRTFIQAERERYLLLYGSPGYRSYPFGPTYPYPFLGPPYRP